MRLDLACLKACDKENALQKFPVFIAASLCITSLNDQTLKNVNYLLEICTTSGCDHYLWKPY